jgi:hypothetical protein
MLSYPAFVWYFPFASCRLVTTVNTAEISPQAQCMHYLPLRVGGGGGCQPVQIKRPTNELYGYLFSGS